VWTPFSGSCPMLMEERDMGRGRTTSGSGLVDRLEGSPGAKLRLKLFLDTLAGRCTVPDACRTLEINESAFHKLRNRFLEEALAGLEPRPVGRPRLQPEDGGRVAALEEQVRDLRLDLHAAHIREEIALAMPHLLEAGRQKKRR
jgi:hypothetical protein